MKKWKLCDNSKMSFQRGLIRICSKKLILGVYSRLAWTYLFDPAQKLKYILNKNTQDPFARWYLDNGQKILEKHKPNMNDINNFFKTGLMEKYEETIKKFENGETPWPVSYAFMPNEIEELLKQNGLKNIKFAGLYISVQKSH